MEELKVYLSELLMEMEDAKISLNLASDGLGILVYVFQALALYTIAKRREIKKPWLAWIPLVNVWILGAISDQYQYVVKGQVKNKRKTLLGLNIAVMAILIIIMGAVIWLLALLFSSVDFSAIDIPTAFAMADIPANGSDNTVLPLLLILALAAALSVLTIIQTVFYYIALYDLFRSCEPKNSTLYLILSLVGNVIAEGAYCVFMILCKDKDEGMPPRKQEPVEAATVLLEAENMQE